jgi:cystathionine beta-lyase/cystathionine gamma-synthase
MDSERSDAAVAADSVFLSGQVARAPDNLVRMSAGLEHAADLIAELDRA